MRTSFYFVLWIVIYPILGLIHNQFIDENSFIVAFAVVLGVSWLLNRTMSQTLLYENAIQAAPVLEDIYSGNVESFKRRLSGQYKLEIATSIYFVVSTLFFLYFIIVLHVFQVNEWVLLLVFLFFTGGRLGRANVLHKALSALKRNPTPEQCAEINSEIYRYDYEAWYEGRQTYSYQEMIPPRPQYYKVFQIFSLIFAGASAILGTIFVVLAVLGFFASGGDLALGALSSIYLLYGSLAAFYGIRDLVDIIRGK